MTLRRNPKPPPDDPEQSKRFINAARDLGTDETGEAFERAFRTIIGPTPPARSDHQKVMHRSGGSPHKGRGRK